MSFKTLDAKQLRLVADGFGIDVPEKATKPVLLTAVTTDEAVTWDESVTILKRENAWDEEDEKNEVEAQEAAKVAYEARPKDTLLKMRRGNRRYDIRGYTFTAEHPYALVTSDDAEAITDLDPDGFVYATPKELKEFYG